MHTPLLSLLHEHRNHVTEAVGRPVTIDLGVRRAWSELFRDDPRIDGLKVLEHDHPCTGMRKTMNLASLMRKGRYDAIILGPPSLRAGLAAWAARIPQRVGYRTDGRSLFLNVSRSPLPRGKLHYSREMIELGGMWLKSLGLKVTASVAEDWPATLPGCDTLSPADLGTDPPIWAVAPGTTYGEAKSWPVDRLGDFLELAMGVAGVRIVLLGDEAARKFTVRLRERFESSWGEEPGSGAAVLDLTGKTDLLGAAGILKSSSAFIGNDSGLMHLAAALDRPTVGVFGSSNPDWTAPLGRHARAVVPVGFSCRPCYRKTCNQKEFCLDTVTGKTVLAAVNDLVDGPQTGGS